MLDFLQKYAPLGNVILFLVVLYYMYNPSPKRKLLNDNEYLRDSNDILQLRNDNAELELKSKDERIERLQGEYQELEDKYDELDLIVEIIAKTLNLDLDEVRKEAKEKVKRRNVRKRRKELGMN